MKKQDLPQDKSALDNFTREVCYVKNEAGNYETDLSTGWEAKKVALDNAWDDINDRIKEAQHNVRAGISSPIAFFMEEKLMDFTVLSGYTGFWKWQIKRHLKPAVFQKLSTKKLEKYATAFELSVSELKNYNGSEAI
ncbi:MAG: hypothetical protein RIT10_212 [Bacteroidota bacterium]|jgi:hypothetical protein